MQVRPCGTNRQSSFAFVALVKVRVFFGTIFSRMRPTLKPGSVRNFQLRAMRFVAWLLGRSPVGALRTGEDLASIRQRDAVGIGGVATVLSRKTLYDDLVSLFQ